SDGEVREACEALWRESRLATSQASASSTSSAMSQRMALARPAGSRLAPRESYGRAEAGGEARRVEARPREPAQALPALEQPVPRSMADEQRNKDRAGPRRGGAEKESAER